MAGWTCKRCRRLTYRRPPNNVCKKCDPGNRIGQHNRRVPKFRLRQKTSVRTTHLFQWQATPVHPSATADYQLFFQALAGEFDVLIAMVSRTGLRMSVAHGVLAVAYAWLEKIEGCKVPLPSSMRTSGLISFAIANEAQCDPDVVRPAYRRYKNISVKEMRQCESHWVNVIGNLET